MLAPEVSVEVQPHSAVPTAALAPEFAQAAQPGGASDQFRKVLDSQQRLRPHATAAAQVRATHTPLSGKQAAGALRSAWTNLFGSPPNESTLAILTAQWSHETGRGRSMFNYNFGGIKGVGPSGLTVSQRTREGWGSTERVIVDNFRAYRSAEEGALDYLSLLKRRYAPALRAAHSGDPEGFVRELKTLSYFTGNEQVYARSITRLANEALGQGAGALGTGGPLPSAERPHAPQFDSMADNEKPQDGTTLERLINGVYAEAMSDEMSRAALRIIAAAGRREATST